MIWLIQADVTRGSATVSSWRPYVRQSYSKPITTMVWLWPSRLTHEMAWSGGISLAYTRIFPGARGVKLFTSSWARSACFDTEENGGGA